MRKYGAASAPQPAVHCQPMVLLARSASTSVSQNHFAPSCQRISRCFTRNDAVTIRTQWCGWGRRKMKQQVIRKLAPGELSQIGFRTSSDTPDLPHADFAEVQVWR